MFELLFRAEHGTELLTELLRDVRTCRTTLSPAPFPNVQELVDNTLDEIWEAARLSVYGDVLLANQHTAAARAHSQEIQKLLAVLAS
ncbi:MAG TPA: hypothetical protein VMW27_16195 [Thermoanaerobaculia bacterium]|nr:hypothetical protein [Thermoanaerobaculia bacterium]